MDSSKLPKSININGKAYILAVPGGDVERNVAGWSLRHLEKAYWLIARVMYNGLIADSADFLASMLALFYLDSEKDLSKSQVLIFKASTYDERISEFADAEFEMDVVEEVRRNFFDYVEPWKNGIQHFLEMMIKTGMASLLMPAQDSEKKNENTTEKTDLQIVST